MFPEGTVADFFHWNKRVMLPQLIEDSEGDREKDKSARQDAETRRQRELIGIIGPAFKAANLPIPDVEDDGTLSDEFQYAVVPSSSNRPPIATDQRLTFQPTAKAGLPDDQHIEVGFADRRLVYFDIVKQSAEVAEAGEQEGEFEKNAEYATRALSSTISLLLFPVMMVLAWRNSVLGRSDRRTAWRVAVVMFFVTLLDQRLSIGVTLDMLRPTLLLSAAVAFQFWVFYLALEPIIRKFWPGILTAWSRAVTGRWRDPSLGHSLLIGTMMATVIPLLYSLIVGHSREFHAAPLSGNIDLLAALVGVIRFVFGWGMYVTIILVLCRIVVRSDYWAALLASALLMVFWFFPDVSKPSPFTFVLITYLATVMFFLIRSGIVATFSFLFCHHLLVKMPLSHDLRGPDLAPTVLVVVIVLATAGYGFYMSVGGHRFFANLFGATSSVPRSR